MRNKPTLYVMILTPIFFVGIGVMITAMLYSQKLFEKEYLGDHKSHMQYDANLIFNAIKSKYRQLIFTIGDDPKKFYQAQIALKAEIKRDLEKYIANIDYSLYLYNTKTHQQINLDKVTISDTQLKDLKINTPEVLKLNGVKHIVYKFDFKPFFWEIILTKDTSIIYSIVKSNSYMLGITFLVFMTIFTILLWIILQYGIKKDIDKIINFFKKDDTSSKIEINSASLEIEHIQKGVNNAYNKINQYHNEMESLNRSLEHKIEKRTQELEAQKQKAENAAKSKAEFLANMSHEIRTPLNAVVGFIDILKEETKENDTKKYIEIIDNASKSLLQIIEDILDFSKIENGKLEIDKIDFDTKSEFSVITHLFEARCKEKNISLVLNIDKKLPPILNTDPLRIKQVISNLISNAVKFTSSGKKIFVDIHYDNERLKVLVKDQGIGIAQEKLEHIFEAFSQEDSSTTRKYGGTGLGLSISKELINLLGGELQVKSEVGVGSEFYFTIPVKTGDKLQVESVQNFDKNFSNISVLLVEDNKANQMFMKVVLQKMKISCDIANDGVEAVEMFQKAQYDIILMDENMPNMNGIEATKKILKYELENNLDHTPIIALTANALKGDKERFLEAGMDEYLTKPLDKSRLKTLIQKFVTEF